MERSRSTDNSERRESARVRVFVRTRPPEDTNADVSFIEYDDSQNDKVFIRDPHQKKGSEVLFRFDKVFPQASGQEEVFDTTCKPLVDHLLDGYNSCCFAYGQTGSGKTYTMFGAEHGDVQGLSPRTLEYLFSKIKKIGKSSRTSVYCSFLEIYNDQIRDLGKAYLSTKNLVSASNASVFEKPTAALYEGNETRRRDSYYSKSFSKKNSKTSEELNNDQKIAYDDYNAMNYEIHEDMSGHVYVKDLSLIPVEQAEDALAVITIGAKVRAVAETKVNQVSSRSHTVFSITVVQKDRNEITTSTMNLIDLAGSERLKKTESKGNRLREALHINTSLAALGKVVMALEHHQGSEHIPYRDSKLTRLLQNSLGGNSYSALIGTIHPNSDYYDECMSTLQFANRCRDVKNSPRINTMNDQESEKDRKIHKLTDDITALKSRIMELERIGDKNTVGASGGREGGTEGYAESSVSSVSANHMHKPDTTGSGPGPGPAHRTGRVFPLARLITILQKIGVGVTSAADGSLIFNDGRIIPADEIDLTTDQATTSMAQNSPALDEIAQRNLSAAMEAHRSRAQVMNFNATNMADVKLKKTLTDVQTENDMLRGKLKERKLTIEQLSQQLKDANYQLVAQSTHSSHKEHELKLLLSDAEHQMKEQRINMQEKFADERQKLLKNNEIIVKEQNLLVQTVPMNLRNFTRSVRENDDIKTHNDAMLQRKYDMRWTQCEQSHSNQIANLKLQYEHWMEEKNKQLIRLNDKFNQFKTRKKAQLAICEKEIVILFDYAKSLEDILRNAEKGNYSVRQTAGAMEMPTTGLFESDDFNVSGPLRLGGILIPRGSRPINPLDASSNGEALSLAKKLSKKARDTEARMKFMKDDAFQKSLTGGLGEKGGSAENSAGLDPALQEKIHSLFLNTENFAPTGVSSNKKTDTAPGPVSLAVRPSSPGGPSPPRPRTSISMRMQEAGDSNGKSQRAWMAQAVRRGSTQPLPRRSSIGMFTMNDSGVTDGSGDDAESKTEIIARLTEEVEMLREKDSERQLELQSILQELEGNETLEYISYLETMMGKLQSQLREANAQVQFGKVTNASLVRAAQRKEAPRPKTANKIA